MAFHEFELIFDLSDNRTEIIKHSEKGLYLKVLPELRQRKKYPADEMVFVAKLYRRGLSNRKLIESSDEVHLQVMNLHTGKNILWSAHLLIEAVRYYCSEHLDRRLENIYVHFNGNMIVFDDDCSFAEA